MCSPADAMTICPKFTCRSFAPPPTAPVDQSNPDLNTSLGIPKEPTSVLVKTRTSCAVFTQGDTPWRRKREHQRSSKVCFPGPDDNEFCLANGASRPAIAVHYIQEHHPATRTKDRRCRAGERRAHVRCPIAPPEADLMHAKVAIALHHIAGLARFSFGPLTWVS